MASFGFLLFLGMGLDAKMSPESWCVRSLMLLYNSLMISIHQNRYLALEVNSVHSFHRGPGRKDLFLNFPLVTSAALVIGLSPGVGFELLAEMWTSVSLIVWSSFVSWDCHGASWPPGVWLSLSWTNTDAVKCYCIVFSFTGVLTVPWPGENVPVCL